MKVTKVTLILGILLIFLTIGAVSATDINNTVTDSGNTTITDTNSAVDVSSNPVTTVSNAQAVSNVQTATSSKSYNITNDSYATYFDESGNIKNTSGISSGDTINIGNINGKNFIITTPLTITSMNSTSVLSNGTITLSTGSDGSTITGLTLISNTTSGITVYSSNNTITKNNIEIGGNNSYAIMAVGGDNNIITYNTINMNGINPYTYAIDIGASWTDGTATIKGYSIKGNNITANIDNNYVAGIYSSGLINSEIADNYFALSSNKFVYGIATSNNWGLTNTTGNITISKNKVIGLGEMVYLIETFKNTEMTITGNNLSGIGDGIYGIAGSALTNSKINNNEITVLGGNIANMNITNNDVIPNGNAGITLIADSTGNTISANNLNILDAYGMNILGSSNDILNNNINLTTSDNYTYYMVNCINMVANNTLDNTNIVGNTITYNSGASYVYGINIGINYPNTGEYNNFTISGNTINGNGNTKNVIYGMYVVGLDNSKIASNYIDLMNSKTAYGITGNNVYGSTIIPTNVTINKNTVKVTNTTMAYLIGSLFELNNYTITENTLTGNAAGIYAISGYGLTNSTINNNNIAITGGNISALNYTDGDAIKHGNAAIKLIKGSTGNNIADNTINNVNTYGVDLESSSNTIQANDITLTANSNADKNQYGSINLIGVYAIDDGLTDVNITNNNVKLSGTADYNYGVDIGSTGSADTNILINGNTITGTLDSNYVAGVYTYGANDTTISNNNINLKSNKFVYGISTEPLWGYTSSNNVITYNNVTGQGVDVRLIEAVNSKNDTIAYNNLKGKGDAVYGVSGYALDDTVINRNVMTLIGGDASNVTTYDMIPAGNAAVILMGNSTGSYITNNTFMTNQDVYINTTGSSNLTIYNNTNKTVNLSTVLTINNFTEVYGAGQNLTGKLTDEFGNVLVGQHIALNLTNPRNGLSKVYWVTTDTNGEFQLQINLWIGTYTATASYAGATIKNMTYAASKDVTANVVVTNATDNRTSTILKVNNYTAVYGTVGNLTGTLFANGAVLVGQHIALNLTRLSSGASKIYYVTTDTEGAFQLAIELGAGKYTVASSYAGTAAYQPSSASGTIVITKA